jgi:hypothetical protein
MLVVTPALAALGITAALAAPAPSGTAILPPELPWDGKSRELALPADHEWATPCERSGLERTPRYDETVAWLRRLVDRSPRLSMLSLGRSAEGRDIWMVVASREGAATARALSADGRPTLLAHAGIHAGEIDGKDAGMMLLRDMTVLAPRRDLLERANFLFVPILNVDGHERFSPHNRIHQRGPVEQGWRSNRRNLNLNRDYAKLETEELQALVAAIREWQPDLYLDLHVTNGADYRYDVTFGYNGAHAWSPNVARWLDGVLTPALNGDLESMGHVPGPLVFPTNQRDMGGGRTSWTADVRFSNGWGDARHLPTVLVENHSLKPYPQRVLGTYVLLESALRTLGREHGSLRRAVAQDVAEAPETIALGWARSTGEAVPESFQGVRSETYISPVSGAVTVRWTGEPVDERIPVVRMDTPSAVARRPAHYYIPAAWYPIAQRLELQGIEVERLERATRAEVEQYRLPQGVLDTEHSPFEGRALYLSGAPLVEKRAIDLPAGSFRVDTAQPLGTLAVLLLEPQAPDSYYAWGYLASILQRTEYFDAYVMEPTARAMLDADPALALEFEAELLGNPAFAADPKARLEWFYERSPYRDAEHRLYPIFRSLD